MALPKWRKSKSKTRSRKANFYGSLKLPNLVKCPNCGSYKESHRVCYKCGQYKGKKILEVKYKND
jgi:large subunit ribosomal protein L32